MCWKNNILIFSVYFLILAGLHFTGLYGASLYIGGGLFIPLLMYSLCYTFLKGNIYLRVLGSAVPWAAFTVLGVFYSFAFAETKDSMLGVYYWSPFIAIFIATTVMLIRAVYLVLTFQKKS